MSRSSLVFPLKQFIVIDSTSYLPQEMSNQQFNFILKVEIQFKISDKPKSKPDILFWLLKIDSSKDSPLKKKIDFCKSFAKIWLKFAENVPLYQFIHKTFWSSYLLPFCQSIKMAIAVKIECQIQLNDQILANFAEKILVR